MSTTHKEMNERFESWRKEHMASLIRMGYPEASRAFGDLGSIHWAAWQSAWQASRESLVIELPKEDSNIDYSGYVSLSEVEEAIHAAGVKTK